MTSLAKDYPEYAGSFQDKNRPQWFATVELRFIVVGEQRILQQLWRCTSPIAIEDGQILDSEWRNVPLVAEASTNDYKL